MKAIILAAGRGSRMKHFTEKGPKCLVNFRGKPLIEWQLAAIQAAGLTEIAIVTGYRNDLLSCYKLTQFHNKRWSETNMLASLKCAEKWLQTGPCIISYSDIFYEKSAISSLINCTAPLAITYDPNWLEIWAKRFEDPTTDAETFVINPSNQITEIGNKTNSVEEVQGQYMGLLRITPQSWRHIVSVLTKLPKSTQDKVSITTVLQSVISNTTLPVIGIPYKDDWGEIDTPSDLEIY